MQQDKYIFHLYIFILLHQAGVFQLSLYDAWNHETETILYFLAKYKHVKFIEMLYRSKYIKAKNVERDLWGIVFSISTWYQLFPLDSNTLAEYFKHKFISESLMQ